MTCYKLASYTTAQCIRKQHPSNFIRLRFLDDLAGTGSVHTPELTLDHTSRVIDPCLEWTSTCPL